MVATKSQTYYLPDTKYESYQLYRDIRMHTREFIINVYKRGPVTRISATGGFES